MLVEASEKATLLCLSELEKFWPLFFVPVYLAVNPLVARNPGSNCLGKFEGHLDKARKFEFTSLRGRKFSTSLFV